MDVESFVPPVIAGPSVLICGSSFTPQERERFARSCASVVVGNQLCIADIGAAIRKQIKAMACKGRHQIGAKTFDLLPNLGILATFGAGYDDIDVNEATGRGICVTNTPGVANDDVADLAVAMMLAFSRDLIAGDCLVRSGDWATGKSPGFGRQISGASVGICGLGRIGREIANRLAAFKMDIHYHARSKKNAPSWTYHSDVVSLARAVDFLIVALTGGVATRNYITRDAIRALGPQGVLINISRGTTVDEVALLEALETHQIAGAGLDVFLNEPAIDKRFYGLQNVILQPHQGSATAEAHRAMSELQSANILAFLGGREPLTPVN